jgi:hypothetical protein
MHEWKDGVGMSKVKEVRIGDVFLDTEKTFVGLNIKYDQGET